MGVIILIVAVVGFLIWSVSSIKNHRQYQFKWKARCPSCSHFYNYKEFPCKNCKQGVLYRKNYAGVRNVLDQYPTQFGCNNCDVTDESPSVCPKCGAVVAPRFFDSPSLGLGWMWR